MKKKRISHCKEGIMSEYFTIAPLQTAEAKAAEAKLIAIAAQELTQQRGELLLEVVQEHFGDFDTLCCYLGQYLDKADPKNSDDIVANVRQRYNELEVQLESLNKSLVSLMGLRPVVPLSES